MDVLEELTLSGGGVTAQKNVDLASEPPSTTLGELLAAATKELTHNAFLYILVLPDAWGESVNELLIELRVLGKILEALDQLLIECVLMVFFEELVLDSSFILHLLHGLVLSILLLHVHVEALLVCTHKVDNVNVGSIDIPEKALVRIDSHTHGLVDANSLDTIAWLYVVHEVLVGTKVDGVRCLTFGDGLRGLLHLDMLFVREIAAVVNHLEGVPGSTIFAIVRL
jgi:hypothetical protein